MCQQSRSSARRSRSEVSVLLRHGSDHPLPAAGASIATGLHTGEHFSGGIMHSSSWSNLLWEHPNWLTQQILEQRHIEFAFSGATCCHQPSCKLHCPNFFLHLQPWQLSCNPTTFQPGQGTMIIFPLLDRIGWEQQGCVCQHWYPTSKATHSAEKPTDL